MKDPQQAKTYCPVVQSTCPVSYDNIKQYNVVDVSKESIDECLIQTAKIAKEHYDKWLSNTETLVVGVTFHNFIARMIAL